MIRQAYTSVVFGPVQFGFGLMCGVLVAGVAATAGSPGWLVAAIVLIVAAVAAHLSTVRLGIGSGLITLRQGPWPRWPVRVVPAGSVSAAHSADLRWVQTLGIGVRPRCKTTRLTVRPGPTLVLQLRDGELIRISTPDADAARNLLILEQERS